MPFLERVYKNKCFYDQNQNAINTKCTEMYLDIRAHIRIARVRTHERSIGQKTFYLKEEKKFPAYNRFISYAWSAEKQFGLWMDGKENKNKGKGVQLLPE